jgi:hypothetical protein
VNNGRSFRGHKFSFREDKAIFEYVRMTDSINFKMLEQKMKIPHAMLEHRYNYLSNEFSKTPKTSYKLSQDILESYMANNGNYTKIAAEFQFKIHRNIKYFIFSILKKYM